MSECRSVERCQGGVGAVSGRCRLTLVSRGVGAVLGPGVGQCRGFLTLHTCTQRRACRSVGLCRVSECRAVLGVSGVSGVGVSGGCVAVSGIPTMAVLAIGRGGLSCFD